MMKKYFSSLTEREQLFLTFGGLIVALFGIYMVIVKPLSDKMDSSQIALEDEKARYGRIQKMAAQAVYSRNVPENTVNKTPIRTAATEASRETGLAISRIQPGRDGAVSFWVDVVEPGQLFNWLQILEQKHGQKVSKVSVQKNNGEETLRGQFEFAGDGQ